MIAFGQRDARYLGTLKGSAVTQTFEVDPSTMAWYVSISTDREFLLFAKDEAIMQHDVEKGTTMMVSAYSARYKTHPTCTTFAK